MPIEGGSYKCFICPGYETADTDEWDNHMFTMGHTLTVQQFCRDCGEEIIDNNHPYPKHYVRRAHENNGPSILLHCPHCGGNV